MFELYIYRDIYKHPFSLRLQVPSARVVNLMSRWLVEGCASRTQSMM